MTDFIWQSTPLIGALVFVLGSCVGSFINVVAYRLPIMARADTDTSRFNLAYPPSHCTSCAQVIKPWQNLPIVGYLWLREDRTVATSQLPLPIRSWNCALVL